MAVCVHGNLCRAILNRTGHIYSNSCPHGCEFYQLKHHNEDKTCSMCEWGLLSRVAWYIFSIENERNVEYLYEKYPTILTVKHVIKCDWMSYDHKVHMCNILFMNNDMPDVFSTNIIKPSEPYSKLKSDLFYGDKYQEHKYG